MVMRVASAPSCRKRGMPFGAIKLRPIGAGTPQPAYSCSLSLPGSGGSSSSARDTTSRSWSEEHSTEEDDVVDVEKSGELQETTL